MDRWLSRLTLLLLASSLPSAPLRAADADADADATPTVVVEGQRATVVDSGVVRVVDSDTLRASDVAELLSGLPGVQVRSSGGLGSYSEASLRGSSGRQVRVLLDGLPLDAGGGEATSLALVSPALLESVEIYQGRVPADLGSGLAGTINLRSRTRLPAPLTGTLSLGSYGQRQVTAAAQLAPAWQLAAGAQSADNDFEYRNVFGAFDPEDPGRVRQERRRNAGSEQHYAQLGFDGALRASARYLAHHQELPIRSNLDSSDATLDTDTYALGLSTPASATWQTALAWRDTREHFGDPSSQVGLGAQDTRSRTRHGLLRVSRTDAHMQTVFSAEHTDYRASDRIGQTPTSSAQRWLLGPAADWRSAPEPRSGVVFNAGLRAQWSQERAAGRDADEWLIEPALGLSRRLGACLLAANLGHRERLPTFFERYGDRGLFRGNPGLDPESAVFADAGARCLFDGALRSAELTVFGQDLRDVISPVYNAQGVGRSVNTERARIVGVEWLGAARWAGLDWQLGGTWQHTEDRSTVRATRGQQLPGRFETQLHAQVARHWPGLTLSYDFGLESGQFYDSANLLEAPSVLRHDLGVRGDWQQLGWSLRVLNLRDDNFEQFNGFPTPGRRVVLALTYPRT